MRARLLEPSSFSFSVVVAGRCRWLNRLPRAKTVPGRISYQVFCGPFPTAFPPTSTIARSEASDYWNSGAKRPSSEREASDGASETEPRRSLALRKICCGECEAQIQQLTRF